jgi:predicted O-methyltransferase YrrM
MNTAAVLRQLRRVRGATPPDVMAVLVDLAERVPADQAIVELGVFHGKTALVMAMAARTGGGAHVWGIDAWDLPGNTYGPPFTDAVTRVRAYAHVKTQGLVDQVTLVQGFSIGEAARWSGPRIGLLFLDDDHSHGAVRANVRAWSPHLAAGAVLAFDDYGHPDWPGVAKAVDEMVVEGLLAPPEVHRSRLAVTRIVA